MTTRFHVEEFVADGIISLYFLKNGYSRERAIEVRKLRGSKIVEKIVPMSITDKGIQVYPEHEIFGNSQQM
jgi:KaiC/GvpD/RAD55 family RecA-like ATPase